MSVPRKARTKTVMRKKKRKYGMIGRQLARLLNVLYVISQTMCDMPRSVCFSHGGSALMIA